MEKITKFSDIPQFTKDGSCQYDFTIEYLMDFLNTESGMA